MKALLTVFTLFFVAVPAHATDDIIKLNQQQIDNLGISTGQLELSRHTPLFTAPAKVVVPAAHDFVVSASQAGLVIKMNASVGDKVAKGEVMGLLNSPDLLTLQGNYLKSVGALRLATATYNRNKKLSQEGVIANRTEQEAYSLFNSAQIEVNEIRQLLKIAGMSQQEIKQLDASGQLVSRISLRSPISGRVIERMVSTGSRVDNMTPLYRIVNLDELWLEINIPQEHIGDLNVGDRVLIENTGAGAEIKQLGQSVNPETQTVLAKALIKDNASSVRVGQKITVQVIQENEAVTYKLPDVAIANHEGKAYIFIKTQDGFKVSQINVVGKQLNASVITGQLTGDERIAINNAVTLKANWLGLGSDE